MPELYSYDKDNIKNSLTIEQIDTLVSELGGEPIREGDVLRCRTICHNGNQHKLYYYDNTKLFRCYTDCGETFDIYELVRKVKTREEPHSEREDNQWLLPEAIDYVARYFGFSPNQRNYDSNYQSQEDWKILNNYDRIKDININTQIVKLKAYKEDVLKNLPQPIIKPWVDEGISIDVMKAVGIRYNPINASIIIPHRDINNRLVGIRERTLVKDNEIFGKYRPAKINRVLYNHPLSFNLYNINRSKDNIKAMKRAFVFEGKR